MREWMWDEGQGTKVVRVDGPILWSLLKSQNGDMMCNLLLGCLTQKVKEEVVQVPRYVYVSIPRFRYAPYIS